MASHISVVAVFVVALAAGPSSPAHAEPSELTVRPGATCVREDSLRPQIDAWLAGTQIEPGLHVDVDGSSDDARVIGFVLREGSQVRAARTFDPGPSVCAQLEASLALAIALALKASLLRELIATPTASTLTVIATGNALLGFASHAPLGSQLAIDAHFTERLAARAGLGFWASANNPLSAAAAHFDLRALALRLEGCGTALRALGWTFDACAGARLGAAWARGHELAASRTQREPWLAASASAIVTLPLHGRWSLELSSALLIALVRPGFDVRNADGARIDGYRVPRVSADLGAGPRLAF